MNKFKKTMLYAGLEKREFEPLLPEAREQNGRYMVMYSSMTAALMDLWNSLFFGSISLLLSVYQMRVKFQLIQEKRKTRQLSETDLLTGVRNRNSFETGRGGYAERCRESLTCVFVDVNGLHELNDTQGHEAGDVMLQTVARAVSDAFGAADTFRIGGDEFVVFSTDVPLTGTRERIEAVLRDVAAMGYSVSVGVSRQEKAALDVDGLVKDAERNMYREKKRYYEQSGHDRRQRVLDA